MAQDRREREFIDEMYKYYNEKKEQVLLPKEKILEIIECLQHIEMEVKIFTFRYSNSHVLTSCSFRQFLCVVDIQ
jgi:hypothetical protein